jgi:hypothetical protein
MNCCDAYGNCNQGRDCPVRNSVDGLPAQPMGKTTRRVYTCADLGVCKSTSPRCTDCTGTNTNRATPLITKQAIAHIDTDDMPMDTWERINYWAALVVVVAFSLSITSLLASFIWSLVSA